jgi:hypothetical protein
MGEDCGGDQGLNWAVERRRETDLLNPTIDKLSQ